MKRDEKRAAVLLADMLIDWLQICREREKEKEIGKMQKVTDGDIIHGEHQMSSIKNAYLLLLYRRIGELEHVKSAVHDT